MARYDVYRSLEGGGYLLDVQTDLVQGLNTRVVVPLLPGDSAPIPARLLNPVFEIAQHRHVMVTQFLSAVPASLLGESAGTLRDRSDEITRALEMLYHGL